MARTMKYRTTVALTELERDASIISDMDVDRVLDALAAAHLLTGGNTDDVAIIPAMNGTRNKMRVMNRIGGGWWVVASTRLLMQGEPA